MTGFWSKDKLLRLLFLVPVLGAIVLLCALDAEGKTDTEFIRAGGEDIALFEDNEQEILFLPSFADAEKVRKKNRLTDNAGSGVTILQSEGLPAIFLTTTAGNLDDVLADKTYRATGKIRAYDAEGNMDYAGGLEGISGRGNYSWNTEEWEKKSFSIWVDEQVPLLGQSAGGKFALLANASDDLLIRNDIGRALQVELGMPFAARGTFTDLYVNGTYMGVYYLCATPDLSSERIDPTQVADAAVRDAFLLEREFDARYDLETEENNGFRTRYGEPFIVRSPRYVTEEEVDRMQEHVESAERAIQHGIVTKTDAGSDTIDVNTFAITYLTEELLKNYDAGASSAYYYGIDMGARVKLYAAPGWDYDMSLGSYLDWMAYDDPTGESRLVSNEDSSRWYLKLYDEEPFRAKVLQLYNTHRAVLDRILTGFDGNGHRALTDTAYLMDYTRWRRMYDADGRHPGSTQASRLLTNFVQARLNYLDGLWITE